MTDPRLSIIPAGAVLDRRLKARDLQVLCVFGRHTDRKGWCRRSQVQMAKEMGCARSTVQGSIERLVEAGWLQKRMLSTPHQSGERDSAHEYRVVLDRDDEAQDVVATPADIPAPLPTQNRHPLPTHGSAPINDPSLTTSLREDSARERFAELWRIFPLRPGQSRKTALKAFLALSDRTQAECVSGGYRFAEIFEAERLARGESPEKARRFVVALVRWIENEGWKDLPAAAPAEDLVVLHPSNPDFALIRAFMGDRLVLSKSGNATVRVSDLERARAAA